MGKITLPFKWIAITAYAVLIIPILIFFVGWLKWYLAILFSGIILFGAFWMIKKDYWDNTDTVELPVLHFILIAVVFGLWIVLSGSCGVGDSTSNFDIPWRTALLRDLIDYDWPVYYPETGANLSYYFIFWMIPALFGKVFGLTGAFFVQWLWMLLIILISFLIITYLFKDYSKKVLWLICIFIIFWSGMNLLGGLIMDTIGHGSVGFHTNEGYCDLYIVGQEASYAFQYRSNQIILDQPYNQILMWLVVPLFMQNRKIHNYAFIGLILLPFSPWGTVGLAVIMVADAIHEMVKGSFVKLLKEIFSVPNLCAIFSVFIVFALFLSCTSRTDSAESHFGILGLDFSRINELIIFWMCEFGIYCIFLWKDCKKDYIFIVLVVSLMIFPLIWIDNKADRMFSMNASMPLLYMLMIYMIYYVKNEVVGKKLNIKNFVLVLCMLIAASTSVFDWTTKAKIMVSQKSLVVSVEDTIIHTYSNKGVNSDWYTNNYLCENADDETKFFKYLAKSYPKPSPVSENLSEIKTIIDIDSYFDYLKGKDCTVYIAVQDIQGYSLRPETIDKLKDLGFNNDIETLMQKEYHSFIGIANNSKIVTQQIGGDEYIVYAGKIDGYPVKIESATLYAGNFSVINIKGRDYSVKGRGLNIVVRDNTTGCVIDSVSFDTHVEENACQRP